MIHSRFPEPAQLAAQAQTCRHLWAAVLVQAMRDIFTPINAEAYEVARYRMQNRQAIAWLGSRDFHQVCALAGLDGTAVEARVRRRLAQVTAGTWCPEQVLSLRPNVSRAAQMRARA